MRGVVKNLGGCRPTCTILAGTNKQPFRAWAAFSTSPHVSAIGAYESTVVKRAPGATPVPEDAAQKAHHVKSRDGNIVGFRNKHPSFGPYHNVVQMTSRIMGARLAGKLKEPDITQASIPVVKPHFLTSRSPTTNKHGGSSSNDGDEASRSSGKLRATWLGHACYFIEFPSGLRVLFDPVLENRCSPFTFYGPRRYSPPGVSSPAELPAIDAVVISHSHYDHLSYPTVMAVKRIHPNAHFFVPLGLADWFRDCGITNVTELDWWEDVDMVLELHSEKAGRSEVSAAGEKSNGEFDNSNNPTLPAKITARFSCLPAQHGAARTASDKNTTLWASWAVTSGSKSVYFGGDTGYRRVADPVPAGVDDYGPAYAALPRCPQFTQIGQLRGPFDLGLLPIGAYAPRFLFSALHANPHDAVEIFRDTRCRRAMGIHWGTWVLSSEDIDEPPRVLKEALRQRGIAETGIFDTCAVGETREF